MIKLEDLWEEVMPMHKRNDNRIIRLLTIFVLLTIITTGGIFFLNDYYLTNTVEAVNLKDSFVLNKEKNPINIALKEEIDMVKESHADILLAEKKKELEQKNTKVNHKIAYLTFDDGPSKIVTPQILDILKKYNIKATFFVLGSMAEKHPEILKRIHNEGHQIGNHTYSHIYAYIYKNTNNFLSDLEKADKVLKSILGEEFNTNIMRFPGGSFGKHKVPFIKAVEDAGFTHFDWNSLNGDSEGVNLSKETLVNRFISTAQNKDNLIVLMHDVDAKATTVDSLPAIIEYLIENGYVFGVLDENYK